MLNHKYDSEQGPAPEFKISKNLENLTKMFIICSLIYFLIAGLLAILMRVIQSNIVV